ncbi:UNVERIFIED_ORG: hypothetical protein ABIC48_000624 [Burkholderia territorii]
MKMKRDTTVWTGYVDRLLQPAVVLSCGSTAP